MLVVAALLGVILNFLCKGVGRVALLFLSVVGVVAEVSRIKLAWAYSYFTQGLVMVNFSISMLLI
jgi:hypothetical protein